MANMENDGSNKKPTFGRIPVWWIIALRKAAPKKGNRKRDGSGVMARDVLVALSSFADKTTGKAWPKQETLMTMLGVSKRSVVNGISHLVNVGILRVTRGNRRKGEPNVYQLI